MVNSNIQTPVEWLKAFRINYYDIGILFLCYLNTLRGKSYSISELQFILKISHKNFLPHLKKLEKLNLIEIKDFGSGKKKEIRSSRDLRIQLFVVGILGLYTPNSELSKHPNLFNEIEKFLKHENEQPKKTE